MNNYCSEIIIINGAIRENGNTDTLIARIIDGAEKAGIGTRLINLREKQIGNCDGCWKCMEEPCCAVKDDMTDIYTAIDNSKLIVFASPMYWCGVTGIMKAFLDRLFLYYHPHTKKLIEGKKAVILTTMNQKDDTSEIKIIAATYKIVFRCIGIKIEEMRFFTGLLEKDAALKRQDYLDAAFKIGKNLKNLF